MNTATYIGAYRTDNYIPSVNRSIARFAYISEQISKINDN